MGAVLSKKCTKCKIKKEVQHFPKNSAGHDGFHTTCKECHNLSSKKYRQENKEKVLLSVKAAKLKNRYGISQKEYNDMFVSQNGNCASCGDHQSILPRTLCVDHCHETGMVRGLLCDGCNLSLGRIKDSYEKLVLLANYIKKYKVKS